MATLREIKTRIQSIKSTQKITSAMKMVSSAKLRKAEKRLENSEVYVKSMQEIRDALLTDLRGYVSPLSVKRHVRRVVLVVFSSNTGLCGSFNTNIVKKMEELLTDYNNIDIEVEIVAVGKKVLQACQKLDITPMAVYNDLIDRQDVEKVAELSNLLIDTFERGKTDQVELIYFAYENKGSQELETVMFLPCEVVAPEDSKHDYHSTDYIFDSDKKEMVDALVPALLRTELFHVLLNSFVSEHAARTVAMQAASDNAAELLEELSLQYNKSRQQAITAELLDILGGTFS